MPKIHAAANRIPVLRTDSQLRDLPELWDNEPTTLDHYAPRTWSGLIRFSITAKTPLVYGNVDDQTGAISIPTTTQTKAAGTSREVPILLSTMVKGMLSNAFERVTSSRLRVFGDHSEALTYRMDPAECQQLVPAFVIPTKGEVTLLTGTHPRLSVVKKQHNGRALPVMMAATLRTKQGANTRFAPGMNDQRLLAMIRPQQGKRYRQVQFDAKLVDNGTYAYWFIYALYTNSEPSERVPIFDENTLTGEDLHEKLTKQIGYVYLTTDPDDLSKNSTTFAKKMAERVFFTETRMSPEKAIILPGTQNHPSPVERYLQILKSYSENWDAETGNTPNIFIRQSKILLSNKTNSFLAYAVLSESQEGHKIVDALVPISVGRNAYALSPLALAQRSHIAPAKQRFELSPADRLFGYVAYSDRSTPGSNGKSEPSSSLKGRISITDVTYAEEGGGVGKATSPLRLRPLLGPRPSSARRFLTRADGSNVNSDKQKVRRSQYFSHDPAQSLGSSTYPVDRNAWENVDEETKFPKKALKTASDSFNVTSEVKKYVKAGTKFDATIRFEALTEFELAWLLWILDSANLVPRAEQQKPMGSTPSDKVGYLRLGTGKPLGLGVVQIDLSPNGFQASETIGSNTGSPSLISAYTELTGCLGTVVTTTDPTQFQVPKHYLKTPWVDAFQRSCFGYDDTLDVRHFTLDENKQNNRTDWETGLPINGAGVEPGILWGSQSGAPIVVPERRKKERR